MSNVSAYKLDFKYGNDFRFVDSLIYIFAKTQFNNPLSSRECEIIREYVLRGYSTETKRHIEKTLKMNRKNLNVYNCNLQKRGFLMPHERNQNNKILNPELMKLREFYLNSSEKKIVLVNFIDENK